MEQIKYDDQGLVPAVVQDAASKEVLMLAYMNRESLQKTVETGQTWFWSRSRGELWNKGATSGHTQEVVSLKYDCDGDTLLVQVNQNGPACHTGAYSCFYRSAEADDATADDAKPDRFAPLAQLEATIAQRDAERTEGSYTTYLFDKGLDKILKKIGEETAEVIIAGKNRDAKELRAEAADLIFHLMVLLREQRIPLDDVLEELEFRHRKPVKKD
ncbi:bifunctional phosphoribosyl-AMP cyclohydrolase/phosphoribosyl-ATP diphosphatase HisIE [Cohnella sp. CFH 77786]|uniref:bifunctional phosphoribosyl-AMP cyclohydrolase/phosphoribosyl-ATP diphosphatase HisIE n=1 Tax=Cohnella sp. CFH 77786 TaxID=2662265 RepID=UPI00210328B5|nr:bifunctional phosphoribosyl-AMP cyclohydrolase/phosphoribosyl-ATP diphosphatase HisIE [Cohnella sp. CFH 77786]